VAATVYVLCALAAFTCAWLLGRSYAQSRIRLLLWSSLCFVGLALNNVILFVDKVIVPHGADLSVWRLVPAAIGIGALVYGLVWEAE
jgi:Family of unknown function (DUF5985)